MGRIFALAQQKGGSGKTTVALNLACVAVAQGARVAILDTDPQGSLGQWFMRRREARDPGLSFATASAWGVSYECEKLARDHDLVLIDTPPKVDADLRPALRVSDLVIVPVASSHLDLWATESVLDLAGREGTPACIVLNRVPGRARLLDSVLEAIAVLGAPRASSMLGNRVAYAEATGHGLGVIEVPRAAKAAEEVTALYAELAT